MAIEIRSRTALASNLGNEALNTFSFISPSATPTAPELDALLARVWMYMATYFDAEGANATITGMEWRNIQTGAPWIPQVPTNPAWQAQRARLVSPPAGIPLSFNPSAVWNPSISTAVAGTSVNVSERILNPGSGPRTGRHFLPWLASSRVTVNGNLPLLTAAGIEQKWFTWIRGGGFAGYSSVDISPAQQWVGAVTRRLPGGGGVTTAIDGILVRTLLTQIRSRRT